MRIFYRYSLCLFLIAMTCGCSPKEKSQKSPPPASGSVELQEVQGQVQAGYIEIQSVGAGPFDPSLWQKDTLNWVPDVRIPMIAAHTSGPYRNIYAPWPLEQANGWRLFYGGWDGTDTPFDQIYSVTTTDFLSFGHREHVIANGAFVNVNNVNVQKLPDGSLHMICTAAPDPNNTNKPVYFSSPDGVTWNGSAEPYAAQISDIVDIHGYAPFKKGDFNGANVLLRDGSGWTLYFKDWNDFGKTYRAVADVLPAFQLTGISLASDHLVNDVKKFVVGGNNWYVMGLHVNSQIVWYSLSNDGVNFNPEQTLFSNLSAQDLNIVALGFVTKGDRLLGILYGACAVATLDQNQIFARWLQKKMSITDSDGIKHTPQGGFGPDRQWFKAPQSGSLQGTISVFAEDGVLLLGSGKVNISGGKAYRLILGGE